MMTSLPIKLIFGGFRILIFVFDMLTLPFYFLIQKPWKNVYPDDYKWATEVSSFSSTSYNEVSYRSNGKTYYNKIELCKEMEQKGIDTMEKVFSFLCGLHQYKLCLGSRQILRSEVKERLKNGKCHVTYEMGEYEWMTYSQMFDRALDFGRGVESLGYRSGTKVVIYADTRGRFYLSI